MNTRMRFLYGVLTFLSALFLSTGAASPVLAGDLLVLETSPTSNALQSAVDGVITVHFDQQVDPSTIGETSFWAFARWSGTVSGSYSFSNGDQTVTLTPDTPFSAGENVMVILSTAITATNGSPLQSGGYSFLFWTTAAPATMQFQQISSFSTRTNPNVSTRSYGGIGSDLDNDGHLDITVINEDTADVRVFLNQANGSGLFTQMVNPPSPVNMQASPNEPTDFNHDGLVDLVVCNIATDTISILLGNGDGTFAPQQQIAVGVAPRGVAVLDVDGDGDVDIVNTNYGTSNMSILLNNGNGVFGGPSFFDGGGSGERSLAAGDMDGDGRLDLVIGMINSGEIVVNLNNGNGTFSEAGSEPTSSGTWMLALGDLNGDGDLDITSVNASQDNGTIHFGNGDGTISSATGYPCDNFPLATDVGDLDGDGDLDWVTSSYQGDWFLFENDGNGNFTFVQEFFAPIAASCAVMMDVDTDGDLDLTLIDELADVVIIHQQEGPLLQEFIRGDASWDGSIDISDAILTLTVLFNCTQICSCPDVLDVNDDSNTDISDPIYTLIYLFSSGSPPPAPFPGCGSDPTPDGLDCLLQPPCP